jgi:hypothetical protein
VARERERERERERKGKGKGKGMFSLIKDDIVLGYDLVK